MAPPPLLVTGGKPEESGLSRPLVARVGTLWQSPLKGDPKHQGWYNTSPDLV